MDVDEDAWCQPALTTNEASALDVTRGELAGPRWRAPHRGVQVPVGSDPMAPLQRIYDAAATLPSDGAVGGWAAGYLLGATDLDGRGFSGRGRVPLPLLLPKGSILPVETESFIGAVHSTTTTSSRSTGYGSPVLSGPRSTWPAAAGRWSSRSSPSTSWLDRWGCHLGRSAAMRRNIVGPEVCPCSVEPCRWSMAGRARSASPGCECCGSSRRDWASPSATPT